MIKVSEEKICKNSKSTNMYIFASYVSWIPRDVKLRNSKFRLHNYASEKRTTDLTGQPMNSALCTM